MSGGDMGSNATLSKEHYKWLPKQPGRTMRKVLLALLLTACSGGTSETAREDNSVGEQNAGPHGHTAASKSNPDDAGVDSGSGDSGIVPVLDSGAVDAVADVAQQPEVQDSGVDTGPAPDPVDAALPVDADVPDTNPPPPPPPPPATYTVQCQLGYPFMYTVTDTCVGTQSTISNGWGHFEWQANGWGGIECGGPACVKGDPCLVSSMAGQIGYGGKCL